MKYCFLEKTKKSILWGDLDSNEVYDDLKRLIESNEDRASVIELDFSGIKSVDSSFVNTVFVKLLQKRKSEKMVNFIFTNVEADSIAYYLNQSFSNNNFVAQLKNRDNQLFSIGIAEACFID